MPNVLYELASESRGKGFGFIDEVTFEPEVVVFTVVFELPDPLFWLLAAPEVFDEDEVLEVLTVEFFPELLLDLEVFEDDPEDTLEDPDDPEDPEDPDILEEPDDPDILEDPEDPEEVDVVDEIIFFFVELEEELEEEDPEF